MSTDPSTGRPKRIPHNEQVRALAVQAVRELMAAGESMTAAASTVAGSTGAGVTSIIRWCRAVGVGEDDALAARDRAWQQRLDVVNKLNRDLTDLAREHLRDRSTAHG